MEKQPAVGADKAAAILKKPALKKGLAQYRYLMERLRKTNVAADAEFQAVYRDFYKMHRFYSDDFARQYFQDMEALKNARSMDFPAVFERVRRIRGTCEMSFASKMAHTIDPRNPIWDSVVTAGHFALRAPAAGCRERGAACCRRYAEYAEQFYRYMAGAEGKALIRLFDAAFPGSGIADVKKIDFILWQDK